MYNNNNAGRDSKPKKKKTMTVRPSVYEREQDPWVGSSHA